MSLPNFTEYQPPGIYWTQTATPLSVQTPGTPNGVAIVGPGVGYRTYSELITLNGTTPTPLTKLGVANDAFIVVSSGSTIYTAGSDQDYTVAQTSGTDPTVLITSITRSASTTIASGSTVTVTYHYTDANYYAPTNVSDLPSVENLYGVGQGVDSNNNPIITSPLTLAAQYAIDNGARNITLVAVPATSGVVSQNDLQTGVNKLAAVDGIGIIVPLPVGLSTDSNNLLTFTQNFSTYLTTQANTNSVFQFGMLGYETGASFGTYSAAISLATDSNVTNDRLSVVYPNNVTVSAGATNQVVGGYYLAAALAGVLSSNPVQQGLTKQTVTDIIGIEATTFNAMTTSVMKSLASNGVLAVQYTRNGQMQVFHGVTTDSSSVYTKEISLVRAQDSMIDMIIQTLTNTNLIGSPIGPNTSSNIAGIVNAVLANMELTGGISKYGSISVTERTVNPTIMDVSFNYVPSYPLNYITVSFGIDTSSGALSGASNSSGTIIPAT